MIGEACEVHLLEFCLMEANALNETRWSFNFTIKAEAGGCGEKDISLEMIYDEYTFLKNVEFDPAAVIESFTCECTKYFEVKADFDGSPGDMMGQLYIKTTTGEAVMTDSCVLDITAA